MNRLSFYDSLIEQDGHQIEHVKPPRDLHDWQQLPVSAIANFRPILVTDLKLTEVTQMLKKHPHQRFPVVQNGVLFGVLTRKEAESAAAEQRSPKLDSAVTCLSHQTIFELQSRLIESTALMVVVLDVPKGKVLGLVTLHDLLRAEVSVAKGGE